MKSRLFSVSFAIWLALTGSVLLSGCGHSKPTNELIEDLKSNDDADRVKAVRFLQNRKGDAAKVVPALIESLNDEHADIRWSAAIGLGYFGKDAKDAIPSLEKLLKDSDGRVRNAAQVAISRIQP